MKWRKKRVHDPRKIKNVQLGMKFILVDMLYDEKISIPEFKNYCLDNGFDYEEVEHCCDCAGCYGYESNDQYCKIVDPKFCHICGKRAGAGYPLTNGKGKKVVTFWACEEHIGNETLEAQLRRGTTISTIIKKWNK